ncbi:unnamed protein product [Urochloa humidicola]
MVAVARLVARRGITTSAIARRGFHTSAVGRSTPTAAGPQRAPAPATGPRSAVARRGFHTSAVGSSTPTAAGPQDAPAPPPKHVAAGAPASPNLVWLQNATDQFDHKANLDYHGIDSQRNDLVRRFEADLRSYRDAASEAHRMVGVSSWRIWMVVASFAMTSYHMVREAEHRASQAELELAE